jgi:hypothetical protein
MRHARTRRTGRGLLLIRKVQVRVLPGAQRCRSARWACGDACSVAIPRLLRVASRATPRCRVPKLPRVRGPSGSGTAASGGALRAIDASARPRSWRGLRSTPPRRSSAGLSTWSSTATPSPSTWPPAASTWRSTRPRRSAAARPGRPRSPVMPAAPWPNTQPWSAPPTRAPSAAERRAGGAGRRRRCSC